MWSLVLYLSKRGGKKTTKKMKQKLRVDLYIMETNQNYTEPHHLIPMAYSDKFKVSLDVEANIVSLCSTCHNHIHYGVGAKDLLTSLYYQRINRLRAVGLDISLEELLQMYNIK